MKLKPKKCKNCGNEFTPYRPLVQVCGVSCAVAISKKKLAEKEKKEWSKEKREISEKLKTLSDYKKEAKIFFQHWIRIRDVSAGYSCISCGAKITIPTSDGSHFFNANQFSGLVFDEMNCHASCQKCNRFEGGRLLDYRHGLIARYGNDYLAQLESKKEAGRDYKWTKQELIDIKVKYQKLITKFKASRNFDTEQKKKENIFREGNN